MALSFPKNTKVQASALNTYEIDGQKLTIVQVAEVSYQQSHVAMTTDTVSLEKISSSYNYIQDVAQAGQTVYGVTTNFGGMAQKKLDDPDCYANLQTNLLWGLKCGVGTKLPIEHVRAAMLARANSLAKGYSGIRLELIERLLTFLNVNAIPIVYERGSIGASGDLIPLSYVAAAIIGISPDYKVQYNGIEKDAISVITELGLEPLKLHPKEGLALVNGTSFMAGIAANSLYNVEYLFKLILHIHAIIIQALEGNPEPFAEFTHHQKAHPGQLKVSEMMRKLLADSQMINHPKQTSKNLVQDRYSIRCLPQFLGAILDGLIVVKKQIEIELNSANDNPLIDANNQAIYHGGNFLGQHIAIAMDNTRHNIALLAKHLDTQIAILVAPEFNNGLPPSLAGNSEHHIQFGLKGLQICANSLVPLLLQKSQPISHLFMTHAEQFNQNINSQGFNAAILTWRSVELLREYIAVTLIFTVQAAELKTYQLTGSDATQLLSPGVIKLYQSIYEVIDLPIDSAKPLVFENSDLSLDKWISQIVQDISNPFQSRISNNLI